jgi:hypothetical protein
VAGLISSRGKPLAGLATLLVAAGLAVVAGASPAKLFDSDGASAEQVDVDTAQLMAGFRRARAQRTERLLHSKTVLGVPRRKLESIADCESHSDPRSIGGGGLYRGKYQFDRGTWASVGGKGDPVKAPELEQDRRAAILLTRSGSNPWPSCG